MCDMQIMNINPEYLYMYMFLSVLWLLFCLNVIFSVWNVYLKPSFGKVFMFLCLDWA